MELTLLSGTGNRFAVLDAFMWERPDDAAALSRALCGPVERGGLAFRPDGLLIVAPPTVTGADCAMILYNADGSRPEACGNGLRCVAKVARDAGRVPTDRMVVETDAGARDVELVRSGGRVVGAVAAMGPVRLLEAAVRLQVGGTEVDVASISVGNPHAVLVVDDERTADVDRLGPLIETHAHFPHRTNVGFLALRDDRFRLRVWERGVGETAACGTGACAAAPRARSLRPDAGDTIEIELRGGPLRVSDDGCGGARLAGAVEEHGTITVEALPVARHADGSLRS